MIIESLPAKIVEYADLAKKRENLYATQTKDLEQEKYAYAGIKDELLKTQRAYGKLHISFF